MLLHAARTPRSCSSASSLPLEAEHETVTCCAAGSNTSDPSSFCQLVASRPKSITSSTLNNVFLSFNNSVSCLLRPMTLSRVALQSVFPDKRPPRYTPVTAVLLRATTPHEGVDLPPRNSSDSAVPHRPRQLNPKRAAMSLKHMTSSSHLPMWPVTACRRTVLGAASPWRASRAFGVPRNNHLPVPRHQLASVHSPTTRATSSIVHPLSPLEVNLQRPEWQIHTPETLGV